MTNAAGSITGNPSHTVHPLTVVLALLTLGFLIAPFATLIFVTDWGALRLAPGDWTAVGISLGYSFISMPVVICLGTPLAWLLARAEFRGKWVADVFLLLPLLTPPLAMGMLLA